MFRFALALMLLIAAPAAWAGDGRRMLGAQEAGAWSGVGRLNIAGNRFCTATLLSPTLAVTAAHCLFNPRTHARVATSQMRFVAGLRMGGHAGSRRVIRAAIPAGYGYRNKATSRRIAADVALLELEAPLTTASFDVAPLRARGGAGVTLVSYARDRAHAPSIERDCRVSRRAGTIAALTCDVTYGASGAPVFAGGGERREVVAIISAMGESDGRKLALAVEIGPLMPELMAALANGGPAQRVALAD